MTKRTRSQRRASKARHVASLPRGYNFGIAPPQWLEGGHADWHRRLDDADAWQRLWGPRSANVVGDRIVFSGGRGGEHSLDLGCSSAERVLAHWTGYCEVTP